MSTREEFIAKLNSDWELVGEYKNVKTPALFRHNKCGHVYMKTPSVVLAKPDSCRFCNKQNLTMSKAELEKKIKDKIDRYEILSDPMGWDKPITIRHKTCGNTFEQRLGVFVKSEEGCPFCYRSVIAQKAAMTHEEFVEKLGDRAKEYEFITKYHRAHEKITVKHRCGNVFEITPDSMLRGGRCKACKYSSGEGDLFNEIKKIFPSAEQGNRTILPDKREVDVYIPELKVAIEYDGLRYHTVEHFVGDQRRKWSYAFASNYHLWKTNECYKKGVRLIHIYEDEWLNSREIVLDMLKAIGRAECDKVYARLTKAMFIAKEEACQFLDNNHIQGRVRAEYYVGLYQGDLLVAVQAYSKLRKGAGGQGSVDWELTRYATKSGYSVIGGFSKCLAFFKRQINTEKIVSYGDLRYIDRDNNVYLKNGFKQTRVNGPTYDYVKGNKRWHRFNFRKEVIAKRFAWVYDSRKTEREMMLELGYERIYNCGTIRYEYIALNKK